MEDLAAFCTLPCVRTLFDCYHCSGALFTAKGTTQHSILQPSGNFSRSGVGSQQRNVLDLLTQMEGRVAVPKSNGCFTYQPDIQDTVCKSYVYIFITRRARY